jgi:putative thioredoxin
MFTVTLENFQTEVVQASQTQPLLLDFGSPRSPQSQTLTTTLARIEAAYGGAFTLAVINCDAQPQVAQAFQVQQVPTTVLFINGQPVDGFSGAPPEAQIKEFLDKHVQAIAPVPPEVTLLLAAREAAVAGDLPAATTKTRAALSANPAFEEARLDLVDLLIESNPQAAQTEWQLIQTAHLDAEQTAIYHALDTAIIERLAAANAALDSPEVTALKAAVAANGKDLPAKLALAQAYQASKAYELALEQFLDIVKTDRTYGEDAGRKGMIAVFSLASDTPDVVRAWRQKLSAALN